MVRDFNAVVGREARAQMLADYGRLPDAITACVGGGSNAIGLFHAFLNDAGVKIVHCLVQRRPDGLGGNHNAKIFAVGSGVDIAPGSSGASLLPELGPAPTDVVLTRSHGIGPMAGTDLDITLRNLGVSTIVAVGVSVNVAITNLVMDAVNLAYRVVVPRDAVAGIPTEYSTSIIDNTLSLLATLTTTDDLIEAWK